MRITFDLIGTAGLIQSETYTGIVEEWIDNGCAYMRFQDGGVRVLNLRFVLGWTVHPEEQYQ
jgi:hypothetical protein